MAITGRGPGKMRRNRSPIAPTVEGPRNRGLAPLQDLLVEPDRVRGWPRCSRGYSRSAAGARVDPFRVVLARPVLVHVAEGHSAQGVAGGGVEDCQVEVACHQQHQDQRAPVVHHHRAREAIGRVALAVPEQEAGREHAEHQAADQGRVQLLAGVEAALGRRRAAAEPEAARSAPQPARVVAVEAVDLARAARQRAAVAEQREQHEPGGQRDGAPEVPGLGGRAGRGCPRTTTRSGRGR